MTAKTALLVLADGCEELEVASPIDVLRLCGIQVTVAGLTGKQSVKCARGMIVVPETSLADVRDESFDVIVMPGGHDGSDLIAQSDLVIEILKQQDHRGGLIAGICGSPKALERGSIGFGRRITSYPLWKNQLSKNYNYSDDPVVQDGNLITARGPAQALTWSLKIAENLADPAKLKATTERMLIEV
jgi:DJ-1 family protein